IMGELFRSEEMTLAQLFLQSEAAYCCVSELGELGMVQFRDLNPDVNVFQRKFVNEVRRCEEMDRKLRFVEKEIKKANIPIMDTGENPEVPFPRDMIDLEATFEKLENELKEINTNQEALKKNFLELTELKHILRRTQQFFDEMEDPNLLEETSSLLDPSEAGRGAPLRLGFVAGVISRERIPTFERMLWRVCRGNVFLRLAEIEDPLEDPTTGDQVHKSVFIIFFQGDQLKNRVKKICEGFRASLYPCPETPQERKEMAAGVSTRIDDLQMASDITSDSALDSEEFDVGDSGQAVKLPPHSVVFEELMEVLNQTEDHRQRVLQAAAKTLRVWFIKVRKMKAIYHTLNLCNIDVTQKCLIAEVWCPVSDLDSIQFALRRGTGQQDSFSSQAIVLSPADLLDDVVLLMDEFMDDVAMFLNLLLPSHCAAPYTIITFPFLFAVMFGDMGHGVLMTCAALYLVIRESRLLAQKRDNEMFNMVFAGRYIVLLMGIFSIYTGMIYNDCFSKSLNVFGSGWSVKPMFGPKGGNWSYNEQQKGLILLMKIQFCNLTQLCQEYLVDHILWVWNIATNKLTFLNSFKMKMSIILGVIHMLFGVTLSLLNHLYFKKPLNIFLGFIPEIVFMSCLFGYLVLLIFYKWTAYDGTTSKDAPSLLIAFINMCLFNYNDPTNKALYKGQIGIQSLLVVIAMSCVPCMLVVKTMVLRRQHLWKKHLSQMREASPAQKVETLEQAGTSSSTGLTQQGTQKFGGVRVGNGPTEDEAEIIEHDQLSQHSDDADEFNFGDVAVHQAIHTIEYCLGCISNTASYLRLWALSLAHAQLSEVLWGMVMHMGLASSSGGGFFGLSIIFPIFATLTVCILLVMEGLSAFLHALRLHWVEFQNKFYTGQGFKFVPFSFDSILEGRFEENQCNSHYHCLYIRHYTTITKELKWEQNIRSLTKKAQQRMYFLWQLKKFLLPVKMLVNFYTAIIESVLTSSITVWFAVATARDKAKLQRVIHSAEKVIGYSLPSFQELYVSRSRRRAAKIAANPSHPGNELFWSLPSGKRLRSIRTRTSCHKNSFFPTAVSLLNSAPLTPR
ncbi:hypothetical protein QTP70_022952, partial [Hemibagrus guttatus]